MEIEEKIELINEKDLVEKLYENLKRHELPDYLLYMGNEGAKNWLTLDKSRAFPVAQSLKTLLEENIVPLVKFIPSNMNLVSMGVGDGEKERILLKELIRKKLAEMTPISAEKHPIRYYPVDVNSQMVEIALENVRELPVEKKGIVSFIEDLHTLKNFLRPPLLISILGNTICNYEPDFILKLVLENLDSGDLFLFDAQIIPSPDRGNDVHFAKKSIVGAYASKENALFNMYPLLQYGIAPDDFDFELLLAPVESRIGKKRSSLYRTKKTLYILKDTSVEVGSRTVTFKEGDTIRMGFTYKYTFDQLENYLDVWGFEILKAVLSNDRTNTIILAKKKS